MKALLATSRTTFVPENYDALVVGLAACPQVGGLLVLDNLDARLTLKSFALIVHGAPRIGWTLWLNSLGRSMRRRRRSFADRGKPVFRLPTINGPAGGELLRKHGFDVVVNARTRCIYDAQTLAIPRLGCLNIHHGLLPEQRGTMCDLWALYEGLPAGFSVHRMTPALDAGEILAREIVSTRDARDYPAYLLASSRRECDVVSALLARIEKQDRIDGTPNVAPEGLAMRRNPTMSQLRAMRRRGLRL